MRQANGYVSQGPGRQPQERDLGRQSLCPDEFGGSFSECFTTYEQQRYAKIKGYETCWVTQVGWLKRLQMYSVYVGGKLIGISGLWRAVIFFLGRSYIV